MLELAQFTGPFGGMLALAFAMGATAGYGFSHRTALKASNERISELRDEFRLRENRLEAEIVELRKRVRELEESRLNIVLSKAPRAVKTRTTRGNSNG